MVQLELAALLVTLAVRDEGVDRLLRHGLLPVVIWRRPARSGGGGRGFGRGAIGGGGAEPIRGVVVVLLELGVGRGAGTMER